VEGKDSEVVLRDVHYKEERSSKREYLRRREFDEKFCQWKEGVRKGKRKREKKKKKGEN